jgi:hypothetical protein
MKTHAGGIVSIIIILGMLIYLHKKIHIVFTRGNTELSQAKFHSEIEEGGANDKVWLENDDI